MGIASAPSRRARLSLVWHVWFVGICFLACGDRSSSTKEQPANEAPQREQAIVNVVRDSSDDAVTEQSEAGFRWVAQSDTGTWLPVSRAFRVELAETLSHVYVADAIERVGILDSVALVVIRFGTRPTPFQTVHRLYSYDLASGRRTLLDVASNENTPGVWRGWRFEQLAQFQPQRGPDVLIRHQSCDECEAEYWLTSLHLQPSAGWQSRNWRGVGVHVFVGSDHQYGEQVVWEYACAYGVDDFDQDEGDELVVGCRTTEKRESSDALVAWSDSLTTFTLTDTQSVATRVIDPAQQKALFARICAVARTSDLCRMGS